MDKANDEKTSSPEISSSESSSSIISIQRIKTSRSAEPTNSNAAIKCRRQGRKQRRLNIVDQLEAIIIGQIAHSRLVTLVRHDLILPNQLLGLLGLELLDGFVHGIAQDGLT